MDFSISKNNAENLEELILLTESYYKDVEITNEDYLKWQYRENPSGKPFLFTSREVKSNELAGQYLVLPIHFLVNQEKILGTLSLNTLTNPKYQGKGLFTRMAKATYEDCEKNDAMMTIGFPNPNSYPGFVRKLNFDHLSDIPLLIKPLRPINMALSVLSRKKVKHGGDIAVSTLAKNNFRVLDLHDETDVKKYTDFWESVKNKYSVTTDKDSNFMKWRYFNIPTREYKSYVEEKDGEIASIAIVRYEKVLGFKVAVLMDFMTLDSESGLRILKYIKEVARHNKMDFIASLHNKTYEYQLLKKSGFLKLPQKLLPQKIHFIVRINKSFRDSDRVKDLSNWKISFGDYDVF